jgi:hypothetical protein
MIGILTNMHPGPLTGFFERVQDVYRAIAPELAHAGATSETEKCSDELAGELARSGLFDPVETFTERWEQRLGQDQYLALLGTFSRHRQLSEGRRVRLFADIGRLINEEYGGYVDQPYSTSLCLARKAH